MGKVEHLTALLQAGCRPNSFFVRGEEKCTAIHWAVANDKIKCIPILLEYGGDPMIKGNYSK